jgi:prolyl 4-hydroxylase
MDDAALAEATRLLRGAPGIAPDPERGATFFRAAAERGDTFAMLRCAVLAAGGIGQPKDWQRAFAYLNQAADAGDADAQAQRSLLLNPANAVDLNALLTPPPLERLSQDAMIGVYRGFVPKGFCAWIIEQGRDRLVPSTVGNFAGGGYQMSAARTATTAPFGPIKRDMIVAVLQERAARACGVPVTHHEAPNLISYEVGQRFNAHFDFLPPNQPGMRAELEALGQRTTTFITYLNDGFEGAATQFPTLGFEFHGESGDALFFSNVLPDGSPDRRTLHAGLPPATGRKWVLSQWLRSKPQQVR